MFGSDQFVFPVWQLQATDHLIHYSVGNSGNEYRTTWYEPPQEAASSSTDMVVRDVDSPTGQFVSTCDVGCGQSSSSSDEGDDQSFTSGSYDWDERYPDPDHVPDLTIVVAVRRVQHRDVARQPLRSRSGWLYNPPNWHVALDRCPSSFWVLPPSSCGSFSSDSSWPSRSPDSLRMGHFDDEFVRWYHPHLRKCGQQMPVNAQMFNKWLGTKLRSRGKYSFVWDVTCLARMRNTKMNLPAIRSRWCIGGVVRNNSISFVRHLEGRRSHVSAANMRVRAGHHVGKNCHDHGLPFPLLSYVRIVFIDRWFSVGSVSFHSFAWPTCDVKTAKSIASTIWTTHCGWANSLVVRGRCWFPHKDYFKSNRVFENLLWRWCEMGRPFVVYKKGNSETGGGHPVPAWLNYNSYCVSDNFCQWNLDGVGASGRPSAINGQGWHHAGMLCANSDAVWFKFSRVFSCNCWYSGITTHYPGLHCNIHIMNANVATQLARSVSLMFADMRRDNTQLVPDKLSRVDASMNIHLSKEESFGVVESIDRREYASCRVYQFLSNCRTHWSEQRPPPIGFYGRTALGGMVASLI